MQLSMPSCIEWRSKVRTKLTILKAILLELTLILTDGSKAWMALHR